uniref:Uncharacterized protein n=1 Tax=Zooxanthella nutricula TaxID=1333877 RepID=A0A7S2Q1N9_9DINO
MMTYDAQGKAGDSMWGTLAIAKALRQVSRYPLLVLTNTSHFPDGTEVEQAFRKLGARLLPVQRLDLGNKGWTLERWTIAFWKLQIWRLTAFEKLIWLDADALVTRSLDWLFYRPGMWAQGDSWFCKPSLHLHVCSGIVLVYPSEADFHGLVSFAWKIGYTLTAGDQQLIERYFAEVKRSPVQLLSPAEASFGQCAGAAATPLLDRAGHPESGIWGTPAFVHKSGGWDNTVKNSYSSVCFTHDLARQRYYVGDKVINACHFNPLAALWRTQFCGAVADAGIRLPSAAAFCDDGCYYLGASPGAPHCEVPEDGPRSAPASFFTGPVEGTVTAFGRGSPAPRMFFSTADYRLVHGQSVRRVKSAIQYAGAALPHTGGLSILGWVRTFWKQRCQAIIAWDDGKHSVELRLMGGDLLYGENFAGWTEVRTRGKAIADGAWHTVGVTRAAGGAVHLFVDGAVAHTGKLAHPKMEPISGWPRSTLPTHCALNGEVSDLSVFRSALPDKLVAEAFM